jgi:hypothetical protein
VREFGTPLLVMWNSAFGFNVTQGVGEFGNFQIWGFIDER